ncbi:hypothetical protein F4818DRAFT_323662 [Hypoxylon cercidicola]|nr:hypothetical protein F4818DRAFT_323662 [Hypoxylon cercidicola]
MPPNSFCEWMVGRNVVRNKAPRKPRPVFSVALETDDESENDTLKLTYPRTGRSGRAKRTTRSKKVRFRESAQDAVVKRAIAQLPLDSDTQVSSESETSPDESTTDDDLIMDCPCTNCILARSRLKKSKQTKARRKKHQTGSSADESEDSPASVHAKHKAKKAKEAASPKSKGDNGKQKGKPQAKKKPESEAETTDATDAETGPETGVETEASTEGGTTGGDTTEAEATEAETTGAETEAGSEKDAPKNTGKKKGKGKQGKQSSPTSQENNKSNQGKKGKKGKQESQDNQNKSDDQKDSGQKPRGHKLVAVKKAVSFVEQPPKTRTKVKSKSKSLSPPIPPPEMRQGNYLLQPRPHLLQVEHTVEVQDDPRPNAFFDNVNGVMRVYHGPAYGNPYGTLYPNRVYSNQSVPLPIGTPHPTQNQWYNGFAAAPVQSGAVSGQPASPQVPPPTPTSGAAGKDQWLQGYGSVTIGQGPDEPQSSEPAASSNEKQRQESAKRQSSPTSESSKKAQKEVDVGGQSNVLPSIEVTSPEKAQDNNKNARKRRDIQSAHDSPTGAASKDEKNGGGKNGGKSSPDKGKSRFAKFLDETMEKDKAAAKDREDRWSDKSGSKEPSPVLQDDIANAANSASGDGVYWPESNEDIAKKAAAGGESFWGKEDNTTSTSGDTQAENKDARLSKGNNGTQDWAKSTSEWNEGNNSGGNTDAPSSGGGSADSSEQAGGSSSANNVLGGNDDSNGSNDGEKKSDEKESNDAFQYVNSTTNYVPGGWVKSPTKSDFSYSGKPRHTSPDNVGGHWNSSPKSSPDKDSSGEKTSDSSDDWGDASKTKSSGNGGSNWQDPDVAQSSGGAFDNDDEDMGFGGNSKVADEDIRW